MEMESKPASSLEDQEAEVEEESMNFAKSLQELRELRSQLHNAADYCETTFLKTKEKKTQVVENTKEYLCRAVVTVVDHLGNVSANLECLISDTNAFSEAEIRINSLKQRVSMCEQYAHKLALTNMQWGENIPRFHSRYLSPTPTLERSIGERPRGSEATEIPYKIKDDLVIKTKWQQPFNAENKKSATATSKEQMVPVRDGISVLTKVPNPTFHFQCTHKVGRHRRSFHGSDILWLIRRTKRTQ